MLGCSVVDTRWNMFLSAFIFSSDWLITLHSTQIEMTPLDRSFGFCLPPSEYQLDFRSKWFSATKLLTFSVLSQTSRIGLRWLPASEAQWGIKFEDCSCYIYPARAAWKAGLEVSPDAVNLSFTRQLQFHSGPWLWQTGTLHCQTSVSKRRLLIGLVSEHSCDILKK